MEYWRNFRGHESARYQVTCIVAVMIDFRALDAEEACRAAIHTPSAVLFRHILVGVSPVELTRSSHSSRATSKWSLASPTQTNFRFTCIVFASFHFLQFSMEPSVLPDFHVETPLELNMAAYPMK